ncbi:MAG: hypothetical protein JRC93_13540 [Deltaproteobacteria bacterium]|nr:hypothetical protein [Deltaproteobacteria bacterium]
MPKFRKEKSELKKITARVDRKLLDQVDEAMDQLGMESRAEFVRMALAEKARRVLGEAEKIMNKLRNNKKLAAALALPLFPLEALPIILVLLWIAMICYFGLRLVRAESPEEQARAQRVLAGCIVAGVLMAIAKPMAFWATGWSQDMKYDSEYDIYYSDVGVDKEHDTENKFDFIDQNENGRWDLGEPAEPNVPAALFGAANRLLDLLMYIGVVVVIGGLIYGGIQLSCKAKTPRESIVIIPR